MSDNYGIGDPDYHEEIKAIDQALADGHFTEIDWKGEIITRQAAAIKCLELELAIIRNVAWLVVDHTDETRKRYGGTLSFAATTAIDFMKAYLPPKQSIPEEQSE